MTNLALDTHKFVTNLSKAGMDPKQAEVIAGQFAGMLNDSIATKSDINDLKSEFSALKSEFSTLKSEFSTLRSEVKAEVQSLWIKVLASQIGIVLAIVGLLQYLGN